VRVQLGCGVFLGVSFMNRKFLLCGFRVYGELADLWLFTNVSVFSVNFHNLDFSTRTSQSLSSVFFFGELCL
jgi:hypothetical protein